MKRGIDLAPSPPQWSTVSDYKTVATADDRSYFARLLPPVPHDCPTHAGVYGPKKEDWPRAEEVGEILLKRVKFIPDPQRTSLMLAVFGQHFSHQFLKTTPNEGSKGKTWSKHQADMTQVYGDTKEREDLLRSKEDGKMKMQIINGEEWPPYSRDVPIDMRTTEDGLEKDTAFALGHPLFNLCPGLLAISTIWLREHNRLAGLLKNDHPEWDDEQLFQTAKMINRIQQLRIAVDEYIKQLGGGYYHFRFEPTLMHDTAMQYGNNRVAVEFNDLYHWHPLIPDVYHIGGVNYPAENVTWHNEVLLTHGLGVFFDSMSQQIAGQPTRLNFGKELLPVAINVIKQERDLRIQPFNQYRKLVELSPYTSFEELTGDPEIAKLAESVYKDVNAVELFPGMMLEKSRPIGLFGQTLTVIGVMCAFQGIFGDPLVSPRWWSPSTFGGKRGWEIVNTKLTLQDLVCRNLNGACPTVSFTVPDDPHQDSREEANIHERDEF